MAVLTREAILAAEDIKRELVSVPEWGGEIYVRGMDAAERDVYEAGVVNRQIVTEGRRTEVKIDFNDDYFFNLKAKLCAKTICDASGARLFNDADVEALGHKSAAALDRVAAIAQRLSGISREDMESLGKNSDPTLIEDSSSSSRLHVVEPT